MGFIEHPRAVWWRKAFFQTHVWAGVLIGLYVIAICASGSALVFERNMLDDAPRLGNDSRRGHMTYGQAAAAALQAHPGASLDNIDMRSNDRRVVAVGLQQGGRDRVVYVDSDTSRIVGDEVLQQKHALLKFLERLHFELAAGATGATMNGIGGALLFIMSATGIVLWWPGKRHWKRALRVQWSARWIRLNWDLHNAFGFWCILLIAMWGLTGAYFIFPKPFLHALALISSTSHFDEQPSNWIPSEQLLPIDTLLGNAMRMYPADRLAYLYMDVRRPHGMVKIFLSRNPAVPLPLLEDVISMQPGTGMVLSNLTSSNWTRGERLSLAVYSIHYGDFGGLPVKVAWAILGLAPLLLVVTGYVMWWNRVLRRKWATLKARARRTPSAAMLRS